MSWATQPVSMNVQNPDVVRRQEPVRSVCLIHARCHNQEPSCALGRPETISASALGHSPSSAGQSSVPTTVALLRGSLEAVRVVTAAFCVSLAAY